MSPTNHLWVCHLVLQLLHCHSISIYTLLLSSVAYPGANCVSLQVLRAPKQDRVYSRGRSKSVAPSVWMFISSNDERDPEWVPPGTLTPTRAVRTTRATPTKVAPGGVTASQSEEERIMAGLLGLLLIPAMLLVLRKYRVHKISPGLRMLLSSHGIPVLLV